MNDQVLTILKGCLLALLYLFLLRVIIVVARELRGTPVAATPAPPPAPARSADTGVRSDPDRAFVLTVREPETRRGEQLVVRGEVTIGRGGGCALALPDDTFASNLHARAFVRDGRLFVEDLGSTNGTMVNNARIETPTRLRKGDRLVVGQTLLEVGK